jgi:hypothetical protein
MRVPVGTSEHAEIHAIIVLVHFLSLERGFIPQLMYCRLFARERIDDIRFRNVDLVIGEPHKMIRRAPFRRESCRAEFPAPLAVLANEPVLYRRDAT